MRTSKSLPVPGAAEDYSVPVINAATLNAKTMMVVVEVANDDILNG